MRKIPPHRLLMAALLLLLLAPSRYGASQGFGSTPTSWALPAGGAGYRSFYATEQAASDAATDEAVWSTQDLNGDGQLDLLVTATMNNGAPTGFGVGTAPYWKVYLGTGNGFAPTHTTWGLPAGGIVGRGFYAPNVFAPNASVGTQNWDMLDMNADGRPDLVVTSTTNSSRIAVVFGTSAPSWRVYLNTGSGFATTPIAWALPAGGANGQSYYATQAVGPISSGSSSTGTEHWATLDMNADGRPDLVATSAFASNGRLTVFGYNSAPYWKVYLNTGSGFALAPITWTVPAGGITFQGFNYVIERYPGTIIGGQHWAVQDLNGDRQPDLVVTGTLDAHDAPVVFGVGTAPHWDVYLNTGSGFAAAPIAWTVPLGGARQTTGANLGFYAPKSFFTNLTPGSMVWSTLDLNADRQPDLVVTSSYSGTTPVGLGYGSSPHWDVYLNTGSGFAAVPVGWTVPAGGANGQGFHNTQRFFTGAIAGNQNWQTRDLNADGQPDLIVTSQANSQGTPIAFGAPTAPHWNVYLASGLTVTATRTGRASRRCEAAPIPALDQVVLYSDPALVGTAYTLTDCLGRTVASGIIKSETQPIALQALAAGVYFIRIAGPAEHYLRVSKQ